MKALGLAAVWLLSLGLAARAVPRVALLDFATDDNSYRSAQAAGDFSVILQASLAGGTNVEWVERAQLDKARQELELSAVANMGGATVARLGKWAKADWTIMGHFSVDDRNQRILLLEITDLQHADVLASQTLIFSGVAAPSVLIDTQQVAEVAGSLQQLLATAQVRQQQMTGKILVAPLFLAEVPATNQGFGLLLNMLPLKEQDFLAALERTAATNRRVQLIHFPQAYRAIGESELVFDGLIETNQNSWQQTADLYVWGTYAGQRKTIPKRAPTNTFEITLHLWDGIAAPTLIKGELPVDASRLQIDNLLKTLAAQTLASARPNTNPNDSSAIRAQIAQSLVDTYDRMTLSHNHRDELGLHDPERFLQAVHMLETACFFDPDSARARALYITCRRGWWMDFRFNVKNEFWSAWRRSQACGGYVNRFGLKPVETELSFPYNLEGGMAGLYTKSLRDVLEMFPHWSSTADMAKEARQPAQGGYSELREAERRGFPKDMPPELAWQWLQEVKAELARRQKRVSEFLQTTGAATNRSENLRAPAPVASPIPAKSVAGKKPNSLTAARSPQRVPAPGWLTDFRSYYSQFQLSPPNFLPAAVAPALEGFRFPAQYEVASVLQLEHWQDKLLILAMDERAAQTSENNPAIAAELRAKRNRLWVLEPGAAQPILFKPELFTQSVQCFLVRDNHLWIAGRTTACLDLELNIFHEYGLDDGLPVTETSGIGCAGGQLFTCGSSMNGFRLDSASDHWVEMPKPAGIFGSLGNRSPQLTGNDRWLNLAPNGSAGFVYDLLANKWQNLSGHYSLQCSAVAGNGFWFGGQEGLRFYDPARQTFKIWPAPKAVPGTKLMALAGFGYMINSTVLRTDLETLDQQIQDALRHIQHLHAKARQGRLEDPKPLDPCHLNCRVPGAVTALQVDGDFLWVGTESHLLLLHLPSESVVANYILPARDRVATLLVDNTFVWIGTAYGDHKLIRLSKAAFTSVPPACWQRLNISSAEREQLVKGMSLRDQALYAFNAAADEQVVQLLAGLDPRKASLEEMFVLLFSCEAAGADQPDRMRVLAEHIAERWPDSPWSKVAQAIVLENEKAHKARQHETAQLAKYDLDHNGRLDAREQLAMKRDPAYQRDEQNWNSEQLDYQMQAIMKQFDLDGDGRLNGEELKLLCSRVAVFSEISPAMLANHKIVVGPLLVKRLPSAAALLQQFDPNHSGGLDAKALKIMAQTLPNR